MLRHMAERVLRESRVIVLDPVRTPDGGWNALAQLLGVAGTARDFLIDLAARLHGADHLLHARALRALGRAVGRVGQAVHLGRGRRRVNRGVTMKGKILILLMNGKGIFS